MTIPHQLKQIGIYAFVAAGTGGIVYSVAHIILGVREGGVTRFGASTSTFDWEATTVTVSAILAAAMPLLKLAYHSLSPEQREKVDWAVEFERKVIGRLNEIERKAREDWSNNSSPRPMPLKPDHDDKPSPFDDHKRLDAIEKQMENLANRINELIEAKATT